MYSIQLSRSELRKIKQLLRKEKRVKVYRRLQAVEMAATGHDYQTIAATIGVCVDTITDWMKLYQVKHLAGMCDLRFHGKRTSPFDAYADRIKQDVTDRAIATIAELHDWIKRQYSLEMEQSWLWRSCKKNSICLTRKPRKSLLRLSPKQYKKPILIQMSFYSSIRSIRCTM